MVSILAGLDAAGQQPQPRHHAQAEAAAADAEGVRARAHLVVDLRHDVLTTVWTNELLRCPVRLALGIVDPQDRWWHLHLQGRWHRLPIAAPRRGWGGRWSPRNPGHACPGGWCGRRTSRNSGRAWSVVISPHAWGRRESRKRNIRGLRRLHPTYFSGEARGRRKPSQSLRAVRQRRIRHASRCRWRRHLRCRRWRHRE